MATHCHDEHDHDHHDHSHGGGSEDVHDHSDDITPVLQNSLYQHIDFDKITTLNEAQTGSGKAIVKKTWAERMSDTPELESDADEQLIIHVPFTAQIKLHSLQLHTSLSPSAPLTVHLYPNRQDLDFALASDLPPTQTLTLSQTTEIQDIPVKRALFGKVQSLTLFVERNFGHGEEEVTRLGYLGFRGEWMKLGRAPLGVVYEAVPRLSDHKVRGTEGGRVGGMLGGSE